MIRSFSRLSVLVALACSVGCGPPKDVPPGIPPGAGSQVAHEDDDFEDDFEDDGESDVAASPAAVQPAWMVQAAATITAHAKGKTRAWDRLATMTDRFGHRLSGSKSLERAIDWAVQRLVQDGFADAHREKVMVPHWVRGNESLRVTAPVSRELTLLGLGMSVGTRGALSGEVAVVDHVDDIAKRGKELAGKIVLINQKMPKYDHEHRDAAYGPTVQARTRGASEAAKVGAKAVLVRSVSAVSYNTPHTGSLSYEDGVAKIPAAAVTHEGAEFLARWVARGEAVRVTLKMGAKMLPDAVSGNVIAELKGREKPQEVVVIGGHIDSWDVGDGASDDGAGCIMAMEALLMLKELGMVPRRTIRVVLFTNEENGLRGAKAYFEAHGAEVHAGAIEADSGAGRATGVGIKTDDAARLAEVTAWAPLFKGLGADDIAAGWGGADISPLTKAGVLSMSVRPDASHYFDLHHSPADTVDKIDPAHLQSNAAVMALMAYLIAEAE
ncbi:MAG: M20/M25/M40 family metallo-hydrolase [Nannocystaceae bacterium]|nr:M20/M25/M40 family metallo-hydrolase [Nannocystaceae bacterium]